MRNSVNYGVPDRVAMTITGHKTRSTFDRQHTLSPADVQEAAGNLAGRFSARCQKKIKRLRWNLLILLVGATGIEPVTSAV